MKATLFAALVAVMIFGAASVAPAQTAPGGPGGADDDQYCLPAEAQYGECDDVTIIVNPPGPDPIFGPEPNPTPVPVPSPIPEPETPSGGGDAGGAEDVAGGGVSAGSAPATTSTAVASASPAPSSAATVGGAGGPGAGVLPDTGGMKLPAPVLGALLIVAGGAALLIRRRSRA